MILNNLFKAKFKTFHSKSNDAQNVTRFIHASDIHLGSHQYRNAYRSDDFIRAFIQILEHAISYHVDFILLGGDVFTSLEMLPGLLTKIVNILKDFKKATNDNILIIAIEGNHDIRRFSRGVRFERRNQSWLRLLNSIGLIILLDADLNAPIGEMFKSYDFEKNQGGKIQIKDIVVYGTHYLGENPVSFLSKIRKALIKNNGFYNILIQHFGIEGQMENVPGVKLEEIQHLRHRVDYLALGHFHKQYVLQEWIYNPGSSEAVCSIDNSFTRGIFLVEISKMSDKFVKIVRIIRLFNRKYLWDTIYLNQEIRNKRDLELYIIKRLKTSLKHLKRDLCPSEPQMPSLYLILKGIEPSKSCRIKKNDLIIKICDQFPIVDVKIYQKFTTSLKTLDNYILA